MASNFSSYINFYCSSIQEIKYYLSVLNQSQWDNLLSQKIKPISWWLFFIKTRKMEIYSCFEKGCLTNREKLTGNGGFSGCVSGRQGVSAWWKETAKTHVFVLSRSLLLNHVEPESSKAILLLTIIVIIPIDNVAYPFTLLWDNICRNSCQCIFTYQRKSSYSWTDLMPQKISLEISREKARLICIAQGLMFFSLISS